MINYRKRDIYEEQLATAARYYHDAKKQLEVCKQAAIEKLRNCPEGSEEFVKDVLQTMSDGVDTCHVEMAFWQRQFDDTKANYIDMIQGLRL